MLMMKVIQRFDGFTIFGYFHNMNKHEGEQEV